MEQLRSKKDDHLFITDPLNPSRYDDKLISKNLENQGYQLPHHFTQANTSNSNTSKEPKALSMSTFVDQDRSTKKNKSKNYSTGSTRENRSEKYSMGGFVYGITYVMVDAFVAMLFCPYWVQSTNPFLHFAS
ncbi:hypothetical protein HDU92_005028 [Lobulomyces angularis]|nr:hypothetical protein HDU92_005028 [Lobulomyces angularis]